MTRLAAMVVLAGALGGCGARTEDSRHDEAGPPASTLRALVELLEVREDCMPMIAPGEDRLRVRGRLHVDVPEARIVSAELLGDTLRESSVSLYSFEVHEERTASGKDGVFTNVYGSHRPSDCMSSAKAPFITIKVRFVIEARGERHVVESSSIEPAFSS